MSAEIPSSMPLSDLLKPTGYNCPSELQGKTFDEATSGSDTKISTNTDKTIDVSAYTEPVVVEPAEGYDATKKATIALTNIPAEADLEANHAATIDVSTYTEPVEIEPTAGKDGMEKATVTLTNIPSGGVTLYAWIVGTQNSWEWYPFAVAPTDITELNGSPSVYIGGGSIQIESSTHAYSYTKVSDTEFTVAWTEGGESYTYTRDVTHDVTIWG